MAYCKSCGAYIPDGQTACLACGYDESAEAARSSGTAAAAAKAPENKSTRKGGNEKYRQVDSELLKKQLEEQRRRQQANSRKWAETEYAQRQKAREEQARNFTNTSASSKNSYAETVRNAAMNADKSKILAGMSYFSALFLVPMFLAKDDSFALFHARQGMKLFIAGVIADILGGIFGLGWLVTLARLYFIYQGVSNVFKGQKKALPYIGNLFD